MTAGAYDRAYGRLMIVLVIVLKRERRHCAYQCNPRRPLVLAVRVNPVSDSVCGIAWIAAVRASSVGPNAGEIEEVPTNSARLRGRASLGTPRSVCVE